MKRWMLIALSGLAGAAIAGVSGVVSAVVTARAMQHQAVIAATQEQIKQAAIEIELINRATTDAQTACRSVIRQSITFVTLYKADNYEAKKAASEQWIALETELSRAINILQTSSARAKLFSKIEPPLNEINANAESTLSTLNEIAIGTDFAVKAADTTDQAWIALQRLAKEEAEPKCRALIASLAKLPESIWQVK